MKKNEMEDLFKKSFENFEPDVNPSVWKNVRIGIKWGSFAILLNTFFNKVGANILIAVISSAAAVISTVAVMNITNNTADKKLIDSKESAAIKKITTLINSDNKELKNKIDEVEKSENAKTFLNDLVKNTDNNHTAVSSSNPETLNNEYTQSIKNESEKAEATLAMNNSTEINKNNKSTATPLSKRAPQKASSGEPLKIGIASSKKVLSKTAISKTEFKSKVNPNESAINKTNNMPIASISANPSGGTAPFIADFANNGTGKLNTWTYNDGEKEIITSSPVLLFKNPGIYSVVLSSTNENGKTDKDSLKIEVKGDPTVSSIAKDFSPNGDGESDVFIFQTKNITKMIVKIFDKEGALVYKSESKDAAWDGKDLEGKESKEGIYYYVINAEGLDGKKYEPKGLINLRK